MFDYLFQQQQQQQQQQHGSIVAAVVEVVSSNSNGEVAAQVEACDLTLSSSANNNTESLVWRLQVIK